MKDYAILLLEPDDLVREALLDILEQEGYTLYPLDNPWEAVSFVKKVHFQIAIVDSSLEDFRVQDLISEINRITPKPSFIITVLNPEIEKVVSFYNSGAEAVLIKPITISELIQALKKSEVSYEKRRENARLKEELYKLNEDRKRIEKGLEKAAKYLPFAELVRTLTHEIKNALTTVNLSLHFLKKNFSPDNPRVGKHLELITQSIAFTNELTMKLLGLTKEKKEYVNFNDFILDTLELLRTDLKNKGIKVYHSLDKDLPQVFLDISALRQVLINIILNAREAMEGGGQLSIRTYLEDKEKLYAVIEINDSGRGIDMENLKKIFLPSYTTKEKGTGLGLYISKKIIEDMGGKIEVNSVLGKGSSFKIVLPYTRKEKVTLERK